MIDLRNELKNSNFQNYRGFLPFELKGRFLDVCDWAKLLRRCGLYPYVYNGKLILTTPNDYMKAYLILRRAKMLSPIAANSWRQELYTKLKWRTALRKKYRTVKQGNQRVILYAESGDYLSIIKQKNEKTGKMEYIVVSRQENDNFRKMESKITNRMNSYYISPDHPFFEQAKKYVDSKTSANQFQAINVTPAGDGYFLNVTERGPKSFSQGISVMKFSEENPMISDLFDSLQNKNSKGKNMIKQKEYVRGAA